MRLILISMNIRRICLGLLVLSVVGCSHGMTEEDVIGSWTKDPAAPSGGKFPEIEAKMVLTFTADHKFVLSTPTPASFAGNWAFDEKLKKFGLTPTTLILPSPTNAAEKMNMPISKALDNMRASHADAKLINSMEQASKQQFLELSADRQKLTDDGRPAFLRKN